VGCRGAPGCSPRGGTPGERSRRTAPLSPEPLAATSVTSLRACERPTGPYLLLPAAVKHFDSLVCPDEVLEAFHLQVSGIAHLQKKKVLNPSVSSEPQSPAWRGDGKQSHFFFS